MDRLTGFRARLAHDWPIQFVWLLFGGMVHLAGLLGARRERVGDLEVVHTLFIVRVS
ncbi:MAG: hypothetical protein ABSA81_09145 [Candidatus Bathyarchaeia archaeon]